MQVNCGVCGMISPVSVLPVVEDQPIDFENKQTCVPKSLTSV